MNDMLQNDTEQDAHACSINGRLHCFNKGHLRNQMKYKKMDRWKNRG